MYLSLQYDVILHRLKKLATHPNADLATPFLLRFLEVIPIQGMRAVEKTVGAVSCSTAWKTLYYAYTINLSRKTNFRSL